MQASRVVMSSTPSSLAEMATAEIIAFLAGVKKCNFVVAGVKRLWYNMQRFQPSLG
jgi:hypothetical protein